MPAITPQLLTDLETSMQGYVESEYQRLSEIMWWDAIVTKRTMQSRRDIVSFLLSTATIRDLGKGGNISFDDLVAVYNEIEVKHAGAGLELSRSQLMDTEVEEGSRGNALADQWALDMGAMMSYWPQKQASYFLRNAHTASLFTGYDGKAFFASDHPLNPFNVGLGTYQNIFTGGASGSYPGACPISGSTNDVHLANLAKIYAYIASIKMPNGEDPRGLRPAFILCSPALFPTAVQLTNAEFIAQAAATGGGGGDVKALVKALGYAMPIQVDELAGFESDTTFFVAAKQVATSKLGAIIYNEREPFRINYYNESISAELNRKDKLEWHCKGRNVISSGHPYLLFKCKAA